MLLRNQMETPVEDILTISDLIRRGIPLTATSSLKAFPVSSPPPEKPNHKPHSQPPPSSPTIKSNPNPKILRPLTRPSILVGILTLPTETLKCSNRNCFQFSDDDSSVCCDILDFSVHVLTLGEKKKKICVFSWNFIPKKTQCTEDGGVGGGFLEIIKWSCHDTITTAATLSHRSSLDSIPLNLNSSRNLDSSKAHYRVHGPVESISPVSIVPCSVGSNEPQNLRGFVMQVLVCECGLCKSKDYLIRNLVQGGGAGHSFAKPCFVYFCGPTWRWHPVMTKLVGNVVALSGLKKKLVFTGKEESELMFVTTDVSVLHLPRLGKRWFPYLRKPIGGRGECGVYSGVVRGIYMKGMVVELDKEVWLLLTDQQLTTLHSLRVGAVISVRNVHFVIPKFSWTKVLVLGACFRTSIVVESFSPLETGCFMVSFSQSQLGKFIDRLSFSAKLWALLAVSCFRRKFTGILSEKEILGSKHKEGLVQKFIRCHVTPKDIHLRHGILKEFCKHDSCGSGGKLHCHSLRLVAPIATFLCHCEAIWMKMPSQSEKNHQTLCRNSEISHFPCEGRHQDQLVSWIIPSEDVGILLLGRLEISQTSGRLQLVDATGRLDVMIPDLPSTWTTSVLYEVFDYNLIVEGVPQHGDHLGLQDNESLSCRHLFDCNVGARMMKLTICVHFCLKNAICRNAFFHPCMERNNFKELESGRFHLIRTTHIYPVLQKYQGDQVIAGRSTIFVETMILPWDLLLSGADENALSVMVDTYLQNESSDHLPCKKQKFDKTLTREPTSCLTIGNYDGSQMSSCSSPSWGPVEREHKSSSLSHEITCSVTTRNSSGHNLISMAKFCCTTCSVKGGANCKPSAEKVLLEFDSESILNCQSLQVGNYYLIKHHPEESFCCLKEYGSFGHRKFLMTSKLCIWSLSFLSEMVIRNKQSLKDASQYDFSLSNREVSVRDQVELICQSSKCYSDICVDVPARAIDVAELKFDEMKPKCPIKPNFMPELAFDDAPHVLSTASGSIGTSCLFPEGDLISVLGDVVAIYCFDHNFMAIDSRYKTLADELHIRLFQGFADIFDIHVSVDDQMVSIFGSLSKNAYPVGFGPGATATFHRVLNLSNSGETNRLMLTPVTFIEVHSIRVANKPYLNSFSTSHSVLSTSTSASLVNVPGTISQMIECTDSKLVEFNGRVVALHVLVLERNKYNNVHPQIHSRHHPVDIPLASFVFDDGSSLCYCWANDERAASLLRLHEELPTTAFESSGCTVKWVGLDKASWKNTVFHLKRILKKHSKITVRNCGSMVDSFQQEFLISVSSDNPLSSSDENLLKFIALNACFGASWTVVASVMDTNAVNRLEKEHLMEEVEMSVRRPLQSLWAVNIRYTNTLSCARKMMQELLAN